MPFLIKIDPIEDVIILDELVIPLKEVNELIQDLLNARDQLQEFKTASC